MREGGPVQKPEGSLYRSLAILYPPRLQDMEVTVTMVPTESQEKNLQSDVVAKKANANLIKFHLQS